MYYENLSCPKMQVSDIESLNKMFLIPKFHPLIF